MTNQSGNDDIDSLLNDADKSVASPKSSVINEEKVENAVAFLLHPKVIGSGDNQKRVFLQRKGLNSLEIQEAFKRSSEQQKNYKLIQQNPSGSTNPYHVTQHSIIPSQNYTLWARSAQVAVGVGLVAGLAFALKQWISPLLRKWVDQWSGKEESRNEEEVVTQMRKATDAMQNVATDLKEQLQQMAQVLVTQQANLQNQVIQLKEDIRSAGSPGGLLSDSAYRNKGYRDGYDGLHTGAYSPHPSGGGRSNTPEPPPYSAAYNEMVDMLNRGEVPSNVRTIDDKPPNPNQELSPSMLQRPAKPWEGRVGSERGSAAYMGSRSSGGATPRSDLKLNQEEEQIEVNSVQRTGSWN
eukprot:TRINITY_DN20505_c0_g1_i1.p1 TRINITY_DN20505_c0_g1~~TRINITY_DN20505_c0_g1_i1.p1  ORF type:complete len:352 (+),score=52.37 TRINITY_DN20505_c0_g1_i1:142-1197(+)